MRAIAGTYRSHILKSLKGLALRPTSDRLRETLFNVLASTLLSRQISTDFLQGGSVPGSLSRDCPIGLPG
jgi:16S rRNA (guanine966-N2)-methyltransferase